MAATAISTTIPSLDTKVTELKKDDHKLANYLLACDKLDPISKDDAKANIEEVKNLFSTVSNIGAVFYNSLKNCGVENHVNNLFASLHVCAKEANYDKPENLPAQLFLQFLSNYATELNFREIKKFLQKLRTARPDDYNKIVKGISLNPELYYKWCSRVPCDSLYSRIVSPATYYAYAPILSRMHHADRSQILRRLINLHGHNLPFSRILYNGLYSGSSPIVGIRQKPGLIYRNMPSAMYPIGFLPGMSPEMLNFKDPYGHPYVRRPHGIY